MIRKRNRFSRPRKAYQAGRISEENKLLQKYGLKNKLEVWKASAKINYYRGRAKDLAKSTPEEQQILFNKLQALGLNANSVADVLALKVEDILDRRLPTVVFNKGLAKTTKEARQMVSHKRIFVDGKVVDIPSYIVPTDKESSISVKPAKQKAAPKEEKQEGETQNE
jgi:small subunit ribosomal protein S4